MPVRRIERLGVKVFALTLLLAAVPARAEDVPDPGVLWQLDTGG